MNESSASETNQETKPEVETLFTESQVEQLQSLKFINQVDEHLKVVSGIDIRQSREHGIQRVVLVLDLFYDNDALSPMTFDLHNYSFDEVVDIARNIKQSEFILTEIDMMLASWGE